MYFRGTVRTGRGQVQVSFEGEPKVGLIKSVADMFRHGVINQGAPVSVRYLGTNYLVEKKGDKVSVKLEV